MALAARDQSVFFAALEGSEFKITSTDINASFFDFAKWGSFGPEFARAGAATFITRFSDPIDTRRVPGFSTAGFCYRKYTATADGYLGTDTIDTEESPDSLGHTAQARFVSHLFLGPFPCGF